MRRKDNTGLPSAESEATAVVEATALCEHAAFIALHDLMLSKVRQVTERVEQIKARMSDPRYCRDLRVEYVERRVHSDARKQETWYIE